jgi:hypothetical protein
MPYQILSASSGERADKCPGSFALDFVYSEPGLFAETGTYVHKYLETYAQSEERAREFLAFTRSEYRRCLIEAIDVEQVFADMYSKLDTSNTSSFHILLEQKFVFDGNRVRMLPTDSKSRDYGSISNFGGTIDWMAVTDNRIYVFDYKTGKIVPPDSEQMRILAGFAYEVYDRPVTTGIVHIPASSFPARAKDKWHTAKIKHSVVTREYDKTETEACATFARDLHERVSLEREKHSKGLPLILNRNDEAQCKRCNSKTVCPEWSLKCIIIW